MVGMGHLQPNEEGKTGEKQYYNFITSSSVNPVA